MRRIGLAAALLAAAVTCGRAVASPHHSVTRAEARARLARLLGVRPQQMCPRGKKCALYYTSPLAALLGARSGKFIEALTINGWKPQLPPG